MIKIIKPSMVLVLLMTVTHSFAEWKVTQDPQAVGGLYRLENTKTGKTTETTWKSEKKAKRSARILNKSDNSVMLDPNGDADYKLGGEIPGL